MQHSDYQFERYKIIKAQRRIYFLLAIVLLALLYSLFFKGFSKNGVPTIHTQNYVARVTIDGVITTSPEVLKKLKELGEDNYVQAVILHVNSPGGTVGGSEALYNAFKKIAAKKPLVVVVDDYATSGAYLTAIAGEQIFANNMSILGSVGVYASYFEVTELARNLGIAMGAIKSAPLKATPNPMEKVTEEQIAAEKVVVDDMCDFFMDKVKVARNLSDAEVAEVIQAKTYSGRQALKLHLIDAIGEEHEAHAWLVANREIGDSLTIKDYQLVDSDYHSFLRGMSALISDKILSKVLQRPFMAN